MENSLAGARDKCNTRIGGLILGLDKAFRSWSISAAVGAETRT